MSGSTLRLLRQLHNYIGAFFAPAILFYAFTGALQTFSLHENHGDGDYRPPAWIVTIASIHKDQVLPGEGSPHMDHDMDHDRDHGPGPSGDHMHKAASGAGHSPLPLKLFVLCLSVGLILSTLLGLTIAVSNSASRRWTLIGFALGCATPVILLFV